ncbi:MAG: NfeD family protein [Clostridia bacterium]|nr:NfeD family protein [Clostridia bacterium]
MTWLVWLIFGVVLLGIELATTELVVIWFALSALVLTIVTAIIDVHIAWQITIFVLLSAVLLLCTRRAVRRLLRKHKISDTNLDLVLLHNGRVVTRIDNDLETGEVKINGLVWTARSVDGAVIEEGALVTVQEIQGNKLLVIRAEKVQGEERK